MKNGRLMFLYAQNYEGDFFSLDKDKKKMVWGLSIPQYGGIYFGQ